MQNTKKHQTLQSQKAVYVVVDLSKTSAAESVASIKAQVDAELALIKAQGISFVDSIAKLSTKDRYHSIICYGLSKSNKTNLRDEDLISQALLLLHDAQLKYFKKERNKNFRYFAVGHIDGNIKNYKRKQNHTSSSDLNDKINNEIRKVKACNYRKISRNLTYSEAKWLSDKFNLYGKKGVRKIYELEAIQFGNIPLWCLNKNNEEVNALDQNNNRIALSKGGIYSGLEGNTVEEQLNFTEQEVILYNKQRRKIYTNQIKLFLKNCNTRESEIFKKRIVTKEKTSLKVLSKTFNISQQAINIFEKNLERKFINFSRSNINDIEKRKIAVKY